VQTKKDKTREQLVAEILQNMYGDKVTGTDDPQLKQLYLSCIAALAALDKYLGEKQK
jgi:hypothetical protein